MNKYDILYNDKIEKNNNIEYIINDKIINNNDINNKIIYNKYYTASSFGNLFQKRSTTPRVVGSNTQTSRQQQTPNQVTPTPNISTPSSQGKTYNANQMWSPQSSAGIVYEWNRGVIGVSYSGEVRKEKLDGTMNHHADATVRIANSLGVLIPMTNAPFQAAIDSNEKGLLIFQSEGDNAFVYFPDSLSEEQLEELNDIVVPRSNFNFSYTYNGEIFEEQSLSDVLSKAQSIAMKRAVGL